MRVADYIIQYIYDVLGVDTIFMVVGGGAMFLNDAVGQNKNIKYICCHHEQAAAMAASAYARYTGKLGVCIVTTGCGGTNALTGVLGAYQDRIPMLIISGQVKTKESLNFWDVDLRQLGVQEANILSIITPITVGRELIKYYGPIKEYLDWAKEEAIKKQGPVWLDIPLNIQGAEID